MSRDNTTYVQVFFVFFCSLFKTNEKTHKKKYFFKIVSSSSQKKRKKKKEKIDFFKATQTKNASAQKREEKDFRARFVFLYHHTTFANSTGERASHRRRERGLNRAKTRSTHAVWRRRERFRGRKIITSVFSAFRRDDDISVQSKALIITEIENDLKNGVETNHERACGAWCCYYFRAGKTSFVFFLASESSRTGRVASRARGLGFRVVFDEFFSFRHFFLFSLERVVFFVVSFYASSRRARKLWRRRRRRRRRSKNGRTQQTMWKNDFDEMTFRFCCTRFRSP